MKKIILLVIPLLLTGCATICLTENKYEYIDLFGNKGTSNNCYEVYRGGALNCEIGEDSLIQVSQYKLVESKSLCE